LEQGLPPYGACNLAHILLPVFFDENTKSLNYNDLKKAIQLGIRAQDIFIDYSYYFSEQNEKVQKAERRIGQGTIGLGTLLIKEKITYGSPESIEYINKLFAKISYWQTEASIRLAEGKGAFPLYDYDRFIESNHIVRLIEGWKKYLPNSPEFSVTQLLVDLKKYGIRNITLSTQAPTGSTGTMLNAYFEHNFQESISTGIEPFYSFDYYRASRLGVEKQVVGLLTKYKEEHPEDPSYPGYFVKALDLSCQEHIDVQAAIQVWTDSSISKTVNCPETIPISEVEKLFLYAYERELKGITIYRDNSRNNQVLSEKKDNVKLEVHTEDEHLAKNLAICPICKAKAYNKHECICLACNNSVCSL
jgi:ribonucleoside-diphosphate reductase alpha chain